MCLRGGLIEKPGPKVSHRHTCITPTALFSYFLRNVSDKYVVTLAVEHVPSAVMELEAHFPSRCPPLQLGVGLYWCSSGGSSLIRPKPKAPRLHQFASALWHTVRIDSSCAQCKDRFVVPTASGVPPAVVPPASRVPPSRPCTLQFLFCCFAKFHTRFKQSFIIRLNNKKIKKVRETL